MATRSLAQCTTSKRKAVKEAAAAAAKEAAAAAAKEAQAAAIAAKEVVAEAEGEGKATLADGQAKRAILRAEADRTTRQGNEQVSWLVCSGASQGTPTATRGGEWDGWMGLRGRLRGETACGCFEELADLRAWRGNIGPSAGVHWCTEHSTLSELVAGRMRLDMLAVT